MTAPASPLPPRCDVVVIGGGAAGLAAALQLGRMRRSVVVLDAGEPRNAPAEHMHGYLGHDGLAPGELVRLARAEVAGYGVRVVAARVERVDGTRESGFTVTIDDGSAIDGRRIVLATGLTDELPAIPGVRERWGREVIHCPYCHGWEVRDRRLVVVDSAGLGAHQALLFRQLSDDVTLLLHAGPGPDERALERLTALGVHVIRAEVAAVGPDGVQLVDGGHVDADVVVVGPRMRPNLAAVAALGIAAEPHPGGFAEVLATSPTGETAVAGVYAAGNVADPSHQVLQAAARGAQVGAFVNMDLTEQDAEAAVRSRRDAARWDERYAGAGDHMWSGDPNGSLVVELGDATPGRLLDIGCGEGADAVWLARRGWDVVAVDISCVAIGRARAAAARAGAAVEWRCADVLVAPPEPDAFDVVTIQYPALLRAAGRAAVTGLLRAVRPGGTLLVVGHLTDPEHARRHGHDQSEFVDLDDVRASLDGWFEIETDEVRPRPNPPAGAPHVDDVVLRARRTR